MAKNHILDPESQTQARSRYYAKRKQMIADLKSRPCEDCGNSFPPVAMDFHHKDTDKEFSVGQSASVSLERLVAEISKCVLLCANCHRIHHYNHLHVGLR